MIYSSKIRLMSDGGPKHEMSLFFRLPKKIILSVMRKISPIDAFCLIIRQITKNRFDAQPEDRPSIDAASRDDYQLSVGRGRR
ncbi:hypothetical protein CEXT_405391 [Caerostris extrusa]|uniref:Uncharacterized protein n=1 Tax=Caerostris extrusa TaxID=172846 RepID=A0AAV4S3V1_CAEEX|nr:hypothetical protein CEXT_405391 [Caerostris extrusa]